MLKYLFGPLSVLAIALLVSGLVALSTPAHAGTLDGAANVAGKVGDTLDKADAKASAWLDESGVAIVFESVFGLTYVGDFWESLCAKIGGEWHGGPGAECVK